MLNTDHLSRCIQTLESALALYAAAVNASVEQEVYRNAIVKGFELTQETTFKLLRKALREFGHTARALDAMPVKEILRLAATHGLLSLEGVERWFAYRDNRNKAAHDYGEAFAIETLSLLPAFVDDARLLAAQLQKTFAGSDDA